MPMPASPDPARASLMAFARGVLFGATLDDKLQPPPTLGQAELGSAGATEQALAQADVPLSPGRPAALQRPGKASFPDLKRLHEPQVRGEVLHFFANHELLAIELMALVLLRFPEAPAAFRLGIAGTIGEEQHHLRLYLARMAELGVAFGDLPLSDYFWNSMKDMRSPLQFVTQMSLTVEQANLDFALFYSKAVAAVGDDKTAALLQRVYQDEIGHVKHGLVWFNRWRAEAPQEAQRMVLAAESEWQAYLRLLPPPMTAKRAKGLDFTPEARREAGFSEDYIHQLGLVTGSKGRPPVVWLYNPHCDSEIARGRPGFTPSPGARRMAKDLAHLPALLALDQDLLLTDTPPRTGWLADLHAAGFALPEFATTLRATKVGGIQPWGWSPDVFARAQPWHARLTRVDGGNVPWCQDVLSRPDFAATGLGPLFAKSWSVRFGQRWLAAHPEAFVGARETCGVVCTSDAEATERILALLSAGHCAMVKAPFGTSGMQVREVRAAAELAGPIGGWLRKVVAGQGEVVVERYLAKHWDLSMQLDVQDDRIRLYDARRFLTGSRHAYRGALLGRPGPLAAPQPGDADSLRLLHAVLPAWQAMVRDLGVALRAAGYRGPAGVDALVWRAGPGDLDQHASPLRFKPLVEVNPRWTMGRVALALEAHLAPGTRALWSFLPLRTLQQAGYADAQAFAEALRATHPVIMAREGRRMASGAVCTNDPVSAREVLTVLATLPNASVERLLCD